MSSGLGPKTSTMSLPHIYWSSGYRAQMQAASGHVLHAKYTHWEQDQPKSHYYKSSPSISEAPYCGSS